ncbi:hypothetical protein BRC68_07885 [Halobacteriales archaeon QH_6_64_20]|nr:MAG: hypothetical protein BRC68_07885 [Halobacteriales archaeon QH_6_64_20]
MGFERVNPCRARDRAVDRASPLEDRVVDVLTALDAEDVDVLPAGTESCTNRMSGRERVIANV